MDMETWFNTAQIKRFYFPGRIVVGPGTFQQAVGICQEIPGPLAVVADGLVGELPFVREALEALAPRTAGTALIRGAPIAQEVENFAGSLGMPPAVVLAVGGGSATDFAKAVVATFQYGGFDGIGLRGNVPKTQGGVKPTLVSVPTTAGSGAEASRYYVTYDRLDHHKVFGKSWSLIADWIMLDPVFLRSMPDATLVSCAFDVFVHLFETLICRYERSRMGQMFSLFGIRQVMEALARATHGGERTDDVHGAMMEAATLGGMAISNVRTGNMHEAAGALLELTNLSHPETLFVFLREAVEQYSDAIADQERQLIAQLRLVPAFAKFATLDDVVGWWETTFDRAGLTARIRDAVAGLEPSLAEVRGHIFQRVYSDKVWITKESPLTLDEAAIGRFIDRSLARFGISRRVEMDAR